MNVIRCENGHFYDSDSFAECPHCDSTTVQTMFEDMMGTGSTDINSEVTLYEQIAGDRELGNQLTDLYVENVEENEKTIGLSFSQDGINPVVGWLVCEEGPEYGRSYCLYAGRNFIGRSHNSDVVIYDDPEITRKNHCSIVFEPKECVFYLVPSSTTVFNGKTLQDAVKIESEDAFEIGRSKFRMIAYCKRGREWQR